MNPLDRMQIFARVAELSSFTQAAQVLGLPKASASLAVQQLEAHLGTRLLHRTTRRVQLTQDGQAFYERCKDLLDDVDELQAMFQQPDGAALRGRVRIDMSTGIARQLVLPALPDLLARHPLLEVELSSTDRRVDLVREGFDCVIRVGPVAEPGLVARPLGLVRVASCASPGYLARKGTPQSLADLAQHDLVHYVSTLGTKSAGFETMGDDGSPQFHPMAGRVTVNSAEAYLGACAAGLGRSSGQCRALGDQRGECIVHTGGEQSLSLLQALRQIVRLVHGAESFKSCCAVCAAMCPPAMALSKPLPDK